MKYFFSLLLIGFISLNLSPIYAATETLGSGVVSAPKKDSETPKEASAEAGSANQQTNGTTAVARPPETERATEAEGADTQQRPDAKPAEAERTDARPATAEDKAAEAQPAAEERPSETERAAAETEGAQTQQRSDAKPGEAQPTTAEERERPTLEETLPRPDGKSSGEERGPIAEPSIEEERRAAPLLTERPGNPASETDPLARQESTTLEATDTDSKIMSLRETNIGKAILEGNIEAYVTALKELTEIFGTSFQSLLKKQTAEGDTLLDLMIETKKNREFFTSEMFHLLIFHVLIDTSLSRSFSQIQPLLEKARRVNNELAVTLLSDLETLVAKYNTDYSTIESKYTETRTELTRQKELKEQVIELSRSHYSKMNIVWKAGFTALAGALAGWGYKLFTNASPDATSYAPQISEFLSKVSDKDISIATMAIGAALAAAGIHQCGKAFSRWRKVNNIRKQY